MYGDLDVLFMTDECDTVLAYENKGKVDQAADRRDPLMDTLSSMNRVQQVELICGRYCLSMKIKFIKFPSLLKKSVYKKVNSYPLF